MLIVVYTMYCRLFITPCINLPFPSFYFQIKKFEKLETDEERIMKGKEIYDQYIMKELLSQAHVSI